MKVRAEDTEFPFSGDGSKDSPYLIQSVEELCEFRDLVNEGEEFQDCYFYQTGNLDLGGMDWVPIGIYGSGHYFYGVYDGGGHYLENLTIVEPIDPGENESSSKPGLFGQLAGIVLNLGIESGEIEGTYCGSIASHAVSGASPYIINCYNKADVKGRRAGGIADNFSGGTIINCWYSANIESLSGTASGPASYDGILIDCFGITDDYADSFLGTIIAARGTGSESDQSGDSRIFDAGLFYLPEEIDIDMLIPWEWDEDENELVFSENTSAQVSVNAETAFEGEGTEAEPYLIQSWSDLCMFRYLVNTGNEFSGIYFQQTADIAIESDDWIPVGICGSGNYFYGIYDGAGHAITGLRTKYHMDSEQDSKGLFGQLGGVVANLRLEAVDMEGAYCGAIAAMAAGKGEERTAAILNCFVSGSITGYRVGGIADYFSEATIANCISDVTITLYEDAGDWEDNTGGILSSSLDTKVYGCRTTAAQVMPDAYTSATSGVITAEDLQDKGFVLRQNIRTALTQELFANRFGVRLMQWELTEEGILQFGEGQLYLLLFDWMNLYLLPVLLLVFIISILILMKKTGIKRFEDRYHQQISAVLIISAILSVFVDCAAFGTAKGSLCFGNLCFVIQIHVVFAASLLLFTGYVRTHGRRNIRIGRGNRTGLITLSAVMLLTLILELRQFGITPLYDASLYYGSLVRGVKLFRLDLFSYIGAFVCWKWAQGSALLIAPLEFLLPGQMTGVYVSNIIITEITIVVMYRLLKESISDCSPVLAALSGAILIFCPYQLGMFTYLNFDTYLSCYVIWLLYSYRRKNNLMIAFCGYLLCFTKITGGIFYVLFLVAASVYEALRRYTGSWLRRMAGWWSWPRCIIWMVPGFLYLGAYLFGDWLTIQHFEGAYVISAMASAKTLVSAGNTLVQAFVFGFRWLFLLIIIAAGILWLICPPGRHQTIDQEGTQLVCGLLAGTVFVILMLLLYNGNAECPRYTAILNSVYCILIPIVVSFLGHQAATAGHAVEAPPPLRSAAGCAVNERNAARLDGAAVSAGKQTPLPAAVMGVLAVLLLIQTYWTIDPVILVHGSGIDTGKKTLYRLALDQDSRSGMNLGADYSEYTAVGDIYAYNIEYSYYNSLIREAMTEIEPDKEDQFYILDLITYEMHLSGEQYPIYWNSRLGKMTYDGEDEDSILLSQESIKTEDLCAADIGSLELEEEFYLVVAARVDEQAAVDRILEEGYEAAEVLEYENLYGAMSVYRFVKQS